MKSKTCSTCSVTKPIDRFVRSPVHKDGYHGVCKPCRNDQRRGRRSDTPEQARKWYLKSKFGITPEDYDRMYDEQKGVCKICFALPETCYKGVLYVDHDHTTGQVRGLLCSACNCGIGYLKDSYKLCKLAAKYLKDAK